MRLFFALWPDTQRQQQLYQFASQFTAGRAVPQAQLHLTTAFLGEVPAERLDTLLALANAIPFTAFELTLDQLGYWPQPQVLWLGCRRPSEVLQQHVTELRQQLTLAHFASDSRCYQAHLTLRRHVTNSPALPEISPLTWPITGFSLLQSVSHRGASYRILQSWSALSTT